MTGVQTCALPISLSSVYHKPAEAFVTRVKTSQRTEEDDFADGSETGNSESPAYAPDSSTSPPASSSSAQYVGREAVAAPAASAAPALVPDLLDLGLDNSSAIVSVDQPATPAGYVPCPHVILRLSVRLC